MKRILVSLSIIAAVAAIVVGATTAFFSDTETSTGNTFTAGTLNLKVGADDPTSWKFNFGDIKPGDSGSEEVIIYNTGSIGGYLNIASANLVNDEMGCAEPEGLPKGTDSTCDNPGPNQGELAENLDILAYLDNNGNDVFNLGTDTLIYQGKAKGILQGDLFNYLLTVGTSKDFRIEWQLASSVGNIVQSDKTGFDIVFELTQNKKEIVGDWHFDENSGSIAYDNSGFGNNGTINGATWTDGKYNPALSFDGNDYVNCGNAASLNITDAITIEAWIYPKTNGNWLRIVNKDNGIAGGSAYILGRHWNAVYFGLFKNGVQYYFDNAGNVPLNQWSYVVATWDGATMRAFVNGIDTGKTKSITKPIDVKTSPVRVGGTLGYPYYFNGTIDEVRVYNRALSPAEILENYQKGI